MMSFTELSNEHKTASPCCMSTLNEKNLKADVIRIYAVFRLVNYTHNSRRGTAKLTTLHMLHHPYNMATVSPINRMMSL